MTVRLVLRLLPAVAPLLLARPARLAAQDRAGPWVPIGSQLDRDVRWAIDAGALRLNPLVRPFRLAAVRAAVYAADTGQLAPAARRALVWVNDRLRPASDSAVFAVELAAQTYSNARRETFRTGGRPGTNAAVGVWASYTDGAFVAVLNPALEERLRGDPEFTGEKTTEVAGRVQAAYVALTGRRGDVLVGRVARHWGPGLFDALLLSSIPYAFEGFSGALRVGRFELTSVAQRLGTVHDTNQVGYNRYFFAHRLDVRLGTDAWLGLVETGVYGGRGQGFEPALHAPLNLALASQFNDSIDVNVMVGADVAVRIGPHLRLEASGFLDDIQTDRVLLTDRRPTSYGATAILHAALPGAPVHTALGYTRVSSLSYRNSFEPLYEYSQFHVGLGRNFSDYDQWLLRLSARPARRWSMLLDIAYFRQGSGDFRQPFPSDSVLATPGQGFLVAPVQRFPAARAVIDLEPRTGVAMTGELGFTRGASGKPETIAWVSARITLDVLHRRIGTGFPGIERADRGWP